MNEVKSLDDAKTWFNEHPDEPVICSNAAGVSMTCTTLTEAEELFSGKFDFGNT